jgi:hypothetical protein
LNADADIHTDIGLVEAIFFNQRALEVQANLFEFIVGAQLAVDEVGDFAFLRF